MVTPDEIAEQWYYSMFKRRPKKDIKEYDIANIALNLYVDLADNRPYANVKLFTDKELQVEDKDDTN